MSFTSPPSISIAHALQQAHQAGLARIDAQLLLLHAIGRLDQGRAWLISHDDALLSPEQQLRWQTLIAQRADGMPVAYLTGSKEFFGLPLHINSATLDPRPDTEILVEWALEKIHSITAPRVLDLGTGSGAIALAIQKQRPDALVWAIDQSSKALAVAQANGQRLGLPVQWLQGDWFAPVRHANLPPFDMIVSNPPYIETSDPHLAALQHEPQEALVSGEDGLDDIRRISQAAVAHLKTQGYLLLEHGWNQAPSVAKILRQAGFIAIDTRHDLGGHIRCSAGLYNG
ncbi:peptide chain release factor N(5)-glutamine methyltransferase [Lampropedia puyangensis]|uniref:Release factor glutamine methyltransferase n=1 Tax=Lampropedia puyangensis TaxID=1330072 RepID=A0A4V4GRY5_9BURK|nr:peptide chain release factor N(5)-glutamine methyltransferase [Lampropedia puyangensis]THU04106.1 peptide chain release factor N(5)-glutamine methyltransferase [Lampropedia puyangensis]